MTILEKQISYGDQRVDYGTGEAPRYRGLRNTIDGMYNEMLRPLSELRETVFTFLPIDDPVKMDDSGFRYLARHRRILNEAVDLFLTEMAGPDRTRAGFVAGGIESDAGDGIIQQRDIFAHSLGVARAGQVVGGLARATVGTGRQSPAVQKMLEHAFDRLSEKGTLRLERIRDQIHGILVSSTDAGLSPIATGRILSKQFDKYTDYDFQRLARTESACAAEAGTQQQFREFGVTHVRWLLSSGACPRCEAYRDQIIEIDDSVNLPPEHPNCLCSTSPLGVEVE